MATEVRVPDIGDFDSVEIIEVFVSLGDSVAVDEPLILLESDKATMEVPSPSAGTVSQLRVSAGDAVAEGDLILLLEAADGDAEPAAEQTQPEAQAESGAEPPAEPSDAETNAAPAQPSPETAAPAESAPRAATPPPAPQAQSAGDTPPHASPGVRLFARELGVDLGQVQGSGPKGRILKEDVQAFVKSALSGERPAATAAPATGGSGLPQMPEIDFSKFGETETRKLSRIRKLSAANLHRNWVLIPHVTQNESADITGLDEFRRSETERGGVKLTMLPFLVKAVAVALRTYPEFNSSLAADGEHLILKKYTHIGFAADTENGLVVPVIRDADRKSVTDLAVEAGELAKKARDGKLSPADMQGGCFSISSLGGIGGSHFTPIVNAPEVAILGVSRAEMRPVWNGSEFEPRLMLPLSLSYDHRVIDGAAAARFVVFLAEVLADPRRLLL